MKLKHTGLLYCYEDKISTEEFLSDFDRKIKSDAPLWPAKVNRTVRNKTIGVCIVLMPVTAVKRFDD